MDPNEPKPNCMPEEVDRIQVNFCKNPSCANFGRPTGNEASQGDRWLEYPFPTETEAATMEINTFLSEFYEAYIY